MFMFVCVCMYEETLLNFYFTCTLGVLPQSGNTKYCYNIIVRDLTLCLFSPHHSLLFAVVSDMALKLLSDLHHGFVVSYKAWGWSCV